MWRLIFLGFLAACGSSDGDGGGLLDTGSSSKPECAPCDEALKRETAPCGARLDACTNMVQDLDANIACFQEDGLCYADALDRASDCHISCGDPEQADVEACTSACFLERADCAERALVKADACFETCADPTACSLCDFQGQQDFDDCDAAAVACADTCKRLRDS